MSLRVFVCGLLLACSPEAVRPGVDGGGSDAGLGFDSGTPSDAGPPGFDSGMDAGMFVDSGFDSGNACPVGSALIPTSCGGPPACTPMPTPCAGPAVCGCDGTTYDTACAAFAAGVAVDGTGASCVAGPECCTGEGDCGSSDDVCVIGPDGSGRCAPRPVGADCYGHDGCMISTPACFGFTTCNCADTSCTPVKGTCMSL